MESQPLTFRLALSLLAVVVLSALSAAEATLAATPRLDAPVDRDWPAQVTPLRDRDAAQPRTVGPDFTSKKQPADHETLSSAGPAANFEGAFSNWHGEWTLLPTCPITGSHAAAMLSPHRLNLPPPTA